MRSDSTLSAPLHPALPYTGAEVVWAVRTEMARTIEDVLARRLRALFLNASAAVQIAPAVGALMARELGWDARRTQQDVEDFVETAKAYQIESATAS
jgi:glycerol-3-phosphate dehydrogenase